MSSTSLQQLKEIGESMAFKDSDLMTFFYSAANSRFCSLNFINVYVLYVERASSLHNYCVWALKIFSVGFFLP